jgi:hypothetical protein
MTPEKYIDDTYGDLVGRVITAVRPMTDGERDVYYWGAAGSHTPVFVLDNGWLLVPSQDAEGNGPGHVFVEDTPV